MKKIITVITLITISLGLNAQDQTINGNLTLNSNADAIMTFNNTDNSWQYFQFRNSGIRKTWMGLDNLNNFNIVKENGGNIYLGGANIGIGVSSPSEKLQIAGNLRLSGNVISYGTGKFTNTSDAQISLYSPDTWAGIDFKDINGRDFLWFNGQHKTFAIGSSGANVANKKLHIEGGTSIGVGYRSNTVPTNGLAIQGNLGIGTSSPTEKLEIFDTVNTPGIISLKSSRNDAGFVDVGRIIAKQGSVEVVRIGMSRAQQTNSGFLTFWTKKDNATSLVESMRINEIGNVGIGTPAPTKALDVVGDGKFTGEIITGNNKGLVTPDSSGALRDVIKLNTSNQIEIGSSTINESTHFLSTGNYLFKGGGNVGIGTTAPSAKLAVNGNIHTKEVKVDLVGWSDFVFEKDYKLPTLVEVEKYIKEKGHLKDIPSEKEVLKNGIHLGEMNAKLLQKIEELTLYTIAQEKKITILEQQKKLFQQQTEKIKKLENKVNSILQHLKK